MDYEKSRKEFYQDEISRMSLQLAEILDNGFSVEISKSRSGLKVYSCRKKHEIIYKVHKQEKRAYECK